MEKRVPLDVYYCSFMEASESCRRFRVWISWFGISGWFCLSSRWSGIYGWLRVFHVFCLFVCLFPMSNFRVRYLSESLFWFMSCCLSGRLLVLSSFLSLLLTHSLNFFLLFRLFLSCVLIMIAAMSSNALKRVTSLIRTIESSGVWESFRKALVSILPVSSVEESSSEISPLGLLYAVRFLYGYMSTSQEWCERVFSDHELITALVRISSFECLTAIQSWYVVRFCVDDVEWFLERIPPFFSICFLHHVCLLVFPLFFLLPRCENRPCSGRQGASSLGSIFSRFMSVFFHSTSHLCSDAIAHVAHEIFLKEELMDSIIRGLRFLDPDFWELPLGLLSRLATSSPEFSNQFYTFGGLDAGLVAQYLNVNEVRNDHSFSFCICMYVYIYMLSFSFCQYPFPFMTFSLVVTVGSNLHDGKCLNFPLFIPFFSFLSFSPCLTWPVSGAAKCYSIVSSGRYVASFE